MVRIHFDRITLRCGHWVWVMRYLTYQFRLEIYILCAGCIVGALCHFDGPPPFKIHGHRWNRLEAEKAPPSTRTQL
jgi:hypothetical protein